MSPTGLVKKECLVSDTGFVRGTSALHSSPLHTHTRVSAVGLERVMRAKIKRRLKCGPSTYKGFLSVASNRVTV